jgi:hypothetical protein
MASGRQRKKNGAALKFSPASDDSTIMVERILNFAALVVRALELTAGRAEVKQQVQSLRDWRNASPSQPVYVPPPAKAYVKHSGR